MTSRSRNRSGSARLLSAGAAICLALSAGFALAQVDPFPSRPITVIVPYTPGAGSDTLMRLVGRKVSESVKQPVIVDNRPGAGGSIAAGVVKNAAPDGYTLLMGHSGTHVFNKVLFPGMGPDPIKDFAMVAPLMSFACVLVVPADSPAKSVSDLVAAAKSKPGGLSYASQGPGNTAHLLGEMFRASSKAPLVHVPYRGNAPAFNDLIAGRVDMMFSSYLSAGPLIESKKLRILAFAAPKRSTIIPDIPTMAEEGYPGVELDTWFGIMAPAGTPATTVARLHTEFSRAAQSEEVRKLLIPQVTDIPTATPEEFTAWIVRDIAVIAKLVTDQGIKVDRSDSN